MSIQKESLIHFRRKVRELSREIGIALDDETSCCGITVSQCHLLLELESLPDISLNDLSSSLKLDKSTLSRTVDTLVKAGFVLRSENEDNRRKISLRLSTSGEEKLKNLHMVCGDSYEKIFSFIPEHKHNSVIEAITLLSQAMKKARGEACSFCQ